MLIQNNCSFKRIDYNKIKNNSKKYVQSKTQNTNKRKNVLIKSSVVALFTIAFAAYAAKKNNKNLYEIIKNSIKGIYSSVGVAIAVLFAKKAINNKNKKNDENINLTHNSTTQIPNEIPKKTDNESGVIILDSSSELVEKDKSKQNIITEDESKQKITEEDDPEQNLAENHLSWQEIFEVGIPKPDPDMQEYQPFTIDISHLFESGINPFLKDNDLIDYNYARTTLDNKDEHDYSSGDDFIISSNKSDTNHKYSSDFDKRIEEFKTDDPYFEITDDAYILKELKPEILEKIDNVDFKRLLSNINVSKKDRKYLHEIIDAVNQLSPQMVDAIGIFNIITIINFGKNSLEAVRRTRVLDRILDPEKINEYIDKWPVNENLFKWLRKTEDTTYQSDLIYLNSFWPCVRPELKQDGRININKFYQLMDSKPKKSFLI